LATKSLLPPDASAAAPAHFREPKLNKHSEKIPRTERGFLEPRFEAARLTGKG
jgi:hypothetical protein